MNNFQRFLYSATLLAAGSLTGVCAGQSPSSPESSETPATDIKLPLSDSGNDSIREFRRQMESVVFVPKGQWITGISISYSQSNQNRYQFLILENLSGDTYTFNVSPMLCFAFKNDMAAGGKFGYSRSLAKLERADIVLDSETSYTGEYIYSLSHSYWGMAIMRNYFSIGRSKRFGFFSELQFKLGGGQSKVTKGIDDDFTGTYMRNFNLNVGLAPGMCIFLNNYSALEVNVGVLGFSYNHNRQVNDRIYVANMKTKSANFKINLFSITFGCTFYL